MYCLYIGLYSIYLQWIILLVFLWEIIAQYLGTHTNIILCGNIPQIKFVVTGMSKENKQRFSIWYIHLYHPLWRLMFINWQVCNIQQWDYMIFYSKDYRNTLRNIRNIYTSIHSLIVKTRNNVVQICELVCCCTKYFFTIPRITIFSPIFSE